MSTTDYSKNAKEMFEKVDDLLLRSIRDFQCADEVKDLALARQILLNELRDGEAWKAYADSMINADPFAQSLNAYDANPTTWGQENK